MLDFYPYCKVELAGRTLNDKIHLDHIYPVSKGGYSVFEDLVLMCESSILAT